MVLAIKFVISSFRSRFTGKKFLSDHKLLLATFGFKMVYPFTPPVASNACWSRRWRSISTCNIRPRKILVKLMVSGFPTPQPTFSEDVVVVEVISDDDTHRIRSDAVWGITVTMNAVRRASSTDHVPRSSIRWTQAKWPKNIPKDELTQFHSRRSSLSAVDSLRTRGRGFVGFIPMT